MAEKKNGDDLEDLIVVWEETPLIVMRRDIAKLIKGIISAQEKTGLLASQLVRNVESSVMGDLDASTATNRSRSALHLHLSGLQKLVRYLKTPNFIVP